MGVYLCLQTEPPAVTLPPHQFFAERHALVHPEGLRLGLSKHWQRRLKSAAQTARCNSLLTRPPAAEALALRVFLSGALDLLQVAAVTRAT